MSLDPRSASHLPPTSAPGRVLFSLPVSFTLLFPHASRAAVPNFSVPYLPFPTGAYFRAMELPFFLSPLISPRFRLNEATPLVGVLRLLLPWGIKGLIGTSVRFLVPFPF